MMDVMWVSLCVVLLGMCQAHPRVDMRQPELDYTKFQKIRSPLEDEMPSEPRNYIPIYSKSLTNKRRFLAQGKRDTDPTDMLNSLNNSLSQPIMDPTMIPVELVGIGNLKNDDEMPGEPLNPNDFDQAEMIHNDQIPLDSIDPIMIANLFQGDIFIPSNDYLFNLTAHTTSEAVNRIGERELPPRNAINNMDQKWANGVIPYSISGQYTTTERATIAKGMAAFHTHTCLRFRPMGSEPDYIHIAKSNGCSSAVGRVGGKQTVSLGKGCIYFGIVIHELMHAAGFWHEQSRADRDDFITIMWSNIQSGMEYNFQKYDWNIIQNLGVTYDTGSIMHYGANSFATDRSKPTIIPRNGERIGQRDNFSKSDKEKLNLLYNCKKGGAGVGGGGVVVPTVTTAKPFITPRPVDACSNHNQHCDYWTGIGECTKNPSWMNENCKKSCGQCGICQDNSQYCSAWKDRGECQKSATYMHKNCRKTCGLCHGDVKPPPTCEDQNQYCVSWFDSGECRINPDYMFQHCKKSCNNC